MNANQSVVDLFQQIASNEFGFFNRLKSVMDVVESNVPTVSCDDTFGKLVGRHDVRSIGTFGVIDPEDRQLIGVLNRSTVQRCFPRFLNTLVEQDEDTRILGHKLLSFVTRPVPNLPSTAAPLEAIEALLHGNCDGVFIYEDSKKVMGIVRPIDFLKAMMVYYQIYSQLKPLQRLRLIDLDALQLDEIFFRGAQTARDIMQTLPTIAERATGLEAIECMHEHNTPHVGLLDANGHVNNVLAVADILIAQAIPAGVRELAEVANRPANSEDGKFSRLDLLPLDVLSTSDDPALQEPSINLTASRTTTIQPTTRIQEVLTLLINAEDDHMLLVKDGDDALGTITAREILRVYKMLFRIQDWGDS